MRVLPKRNWIIMALHVLHLYWQTGNVQIDVGDPFRLGLDSPTFGSGVQRPLYQYLTIENFAFMHGGNQIDLLLPRFWPLRSFLPQFLQRSPLGGEAN